MYGSSQLTFFMVLMITFAVFMVITSWRILTKAGEPGWACLIPIYGQYKMAVVAWDDGSKFWVYLFVSIIGNLLSTFLVRVPVIAGIVSLALAAYSIYYMISFAKGLADSFGKDGGFVVGLVLLPIVFQPILAFGDAEHWKHRVEKRTAVKAQPVVSQEASKPGPWWPVIFAVLLLLEGVVESIIFYAPRLANGQYFYNNGYELWLIFGNIVFAGLFSAALILERKNQLKAAFYCAVARVAFVAINRLINVLFFWAGMNLNVYFVMSFFVPVALLLFILSRKNANNVLLYAAYAVFAVYQIYNWVDIFSNI